MTGLIAHDWIEPIGGAEKVLDEMAVTFPDAPIVTSWNDAPGRFAPGRVRESVLARTPLRRHKALALPVMLQTWRHLSVPDVEWILCSSHLFAHHARLAGAARDVPKYAYVHTPARYIWAREFDERGAGLARWGAIPLGAIDRRRAQEPVRIAAVSRFIAERIERSWHRESTVVHPPVDVAGIIAADPDELTGPDQDRLDRLPESFLFGASRFVPYKRLDLVIEAGIATGMPVVLAGDGPDRARLDVLAQRHPGAVTFLGRTSTGLLREVYRRAAVFVFPAVEDFGIMPVEAMASGTGVVVSSLGGSSESVLDGLTGAHLRSSDPAELRRAVEVASRVDPATCRQRAGEFDGSTFGSRLVDWMS